MKKPIITKAQAEEIKKTYPTPFHIYDEKGIKDNARRVYDAFSWCAGFKEHFAVKATPNPTIMKILHSLGCGMDCSSLTELMLCEKCGIVGDDIMFTSNETPAEEYALALRLGATITLDDITHVDFLAKVAGGKMPKTVSLRFNNGKDFAINKQIMGTPQDAKYGMTRAQLTEAVRKLQALGVESFGLHAFLASNNLGNEYYPTLAGILFDTACELHAETGANFKFVNLSGGIGIPYLPTDEMPDIYAIADGVKAQYERAFTGDMKPSLRTELGRFMLGPYGNLIVRRIPPHHRARQGERALRPQVRRRRFAVRKQRQIRGRPHAARVGDRRHPRDPRRRRARLLDGLQLQRQIAQRGAVAARGRLGQTHSPRRDPGRLLRDYDLRLSEQNKQQANIPKRPPRDVFCRNTLHLSSRYNRLVGVYSVFHSI